jgi:hypothetical protein
MQHLFGHKELTDKELADLARSLALLADSEQKTTIGNLVKRLCYQTLGKTNHRQLRRDPDRIAK